VSELDLVTGATGFIGGYLVRRLLGEGRSVRALCRARSLGKLPPATRARVDVALGDLTDRASLERAASGVTRVFHAAGEVSDWGPLSRFDATNVEGTQWLLEASRDAGATRFVHLSSFVVFGVPSPPEIDDASPYGTGRDAYTRTKIEGEKAVLAFHRETRFPVAVLRPTVVYGHGGTWLEEPMRMMKRGAFFLIGGGRGTCHPCYVENLVDALLLAAEHPRAVGEAFLVDDDDPICFRDYFTALASLAEAPAPQRSIPIAAARAMALGLEGTARLLRTRSRPLLTRTAIDLVTTDSRLSTQKIRTELGFVPRYSFRDAMREMALAKALA
jgi:nucleoside-diphosphate-sugar epimerase